MADPTAEQFGVWAKQTRADMANVLGKPPNDVNNVHGIAALMWHRTPYGGSQNRADVKALFAANHAPPPLPPIDPPGQLASVVAGHWAGHFLVGDETGPESEFYFSPSCAAWTHGRRARLFRWYRDNGYTSVVLNAENRDWGPSKGHPEYTAGGWQSHDTDAHLQQFVDVCIEARAYGLTPVVGMFDQPSVTGRPMSELIRLGQRLVDATHMHTNLYWLSWEYSYVLPVSSARRAWEDRMIGDIDYRDRSVGIHYQPALETLAPGTTCENYKDLQRDTGMSGGITRYTELEAHLGGAGHVIRLMQYARNATEATIRLQTRCAMTVHGWGPGQHRLGGFIAAEHSASIRLSNHTPAQIARRRGWIMDEVTQANIPADRAGFLN